MPTLDIILRQVPEGFEFLAVFITIIITLLIMIAFGKWWER
ncbi:MAG: hypothetical protein ACE5KW_05850 [Dehalococcoidia bacterium]